MNMKGWIKLKSVGISIVILTCFYFIYKQHLPMAETKACDCSKSKQDQERSLPSGKFYKIVDNRKSVRHIYQIIETPHETVLTEVAKVPDFVDDQVDVRKLPTDQYMFYELFWTYTIKNTFQYACSHQVRFGHKAGYEVCLDEPYRPGQPCIVYSFGSFFMFDFEEHVIKHHQCEVHTYDPSHPIANHVIPQGVNFHLVGLWDNVTTNKLGWKMQTFSDIRRTLKHTQKTIDILKIDIEGGEWVSLAHALRSGELRFVKQLQIELHLWGQKRVGMSLVGKLTVLKHLYEQGFRIFYHEPFLTGDCIRSMRRIHPKITLCVILSLVNSKYQPSL